MHDYETLTESKYEFFTELSVVIIKDNQVINFSVVIGIVIIINQIVFFVLESIFAFRILI